MKFQLVEIETSFPMMFVLCTSWVGLDMELQRTASAAVNSQRELKFCRVVVLIFSVESESVLEFLFIG